jgi:glycosyltransferase involved in cell wall biosynthesis
MSKVIANVNAKLYILGRGEEETNLKNLAEKLGVSSCIEFIKKSIPNEEMPGIYSSCDLYVQPSIVEPYGIAVLEAMACGRPVIGTNTGGMLDTIEHGRTGFIAKVASSEEIAKYIVQLSDPKLRKKMGRNARERARKFEWMEIGKKYIKLLNSF